jgi:hypothetical protein
MFEGANVSVSSFSVQQLTLNAFWGAFGALGLTEVEQGPTNPLPTLSGRGLP